MGLMGWPGCGVMFSDLKDRSCFFAKGMIWV